MIETIHSINFDLIPHQITKTKLKIHLFKNADRFICLACHMPIQVLTGFGIFRGICND